MQWYAAVVGNSTDYGDVADQIARAFERVYGAAVDAAAVFGHVDDAADRFTAFFNPQASWLARLHGATPCEPPVGAALFTIADHDGRALELEFPAELSVK